MLKYIYIIIPLKLFFKLNDDNFEVIAYDYLLYIFFELRKIPLIISSLLLEIQSHE